MRKLYNILILTLMVALAGCADLQKSDPYQSSLNRLTVTVKFPEDASSQSLEGIDINIVDRNSNSSFSAETDPEGRVSLELPNGSYRLSASEKVDGGVFNASADRIVLSGAGRDVTLNMEYAKLGSLVFKELYFGGCTRYPESGNYQYDAYVIIHNNSSETQYLDGLCFGALDPYNSVSTNVWVTTDPVTGETVFQDFVPIIQAVWQFGGSGQTFPLAPGEDAVVSIYGAINHAAQFPNSVNLNKEGYFVCYNNTYFPNPTYHPAPGNNIAQDHYLDVVIKTGQANAYAFSINSPAAVIFRAPEGTTMHDFVSDPENVVQKPGSSVDRVVKIPLDWVVDAVEVFQQGGRNTKRIPTSLDAGNFPFSGSFQGHSVMRYVDEEVSASQGYEVLADTNNSTNDFYETEKQSLHE